MEALDIAALGVFSSYFITIVSLLLYVQRDLNVLRSSKHPKTSSRAVALFVGLTIASFGHTWYYMFGYMKWSFQQHGQRHQGSLSDDLLERITRWLRTNGLFEEAWAAVCSKPLNWWWSEQLCLFTVGAWTIFLAVEGKRRQIKHLWAYMILGQIVAISVASNLFYLALCLAPASINALDIRKMKATPVLWLSVLLSLGTVALSPFTSERTFLPNLLVMHALLVIPLLSNRAVVASSESPSFAISVTFLYRIVYLASAAIRVRSVLGAVETLNQFYQSPGPLSETSFRFLSTAWRVMRAHPAQSSIGWDIIWTSLSFIAWMAVRPTSSREPSKYIAVAYLVLATPLASIGVTAPYILPPRGEEPEGSTETAAKDD